jgi:hypothetical protein
MSARCFANRERMLAVNFDFIFMSIIGAGVVLSGAYIRAEYRSWHNQGAAARRRGSVLRELHAASLSQQQNARLEPSVVELQTFTGTLAAATDEIADDEARRRSQARSGAQRNHPFVERRARERPRATH